MRLPPSDDPVWVEFTRLGARTMERGWKEHGLVMPAGVADVLGRVTWEHLRHRVPPLTDGTFFNYPGSRLVSVVRQVERELSRGHDDPAFLGVLGERLRQDLLAYEQEGPDGRDASA